MPNLKLAKEIMFKAQKQGASDVEVWMEHGEATTIEIKDQKIDVFKLSEGSGISLRIFKNKQMGFAFSSDSSESAINKMIKDAIDSAQPATPDEFNCLPGPVSKYPQIPGADKEMPKISVSEKIERAKEIEKSAYDYDKRIDKIRSAGYSDTQYEVLIANNHGVELGSDGSLASMSVMAVATENNDSQTGWEMDLSRHYKNLVSPKSVGETAARRAISLLGAQTLSTRQTSIIFANYAANDLLEMYTSAFSAEAIQKGKSLLIGREGQKIASSVVNIVDDGLYKKGLHSSPADGEGVPTQTTPLIKDGILVGMLHNSYTAAKAGTVSTGNGMRGGYKTSPGVGISNFFLEPGEITLEELFQSADSGMYVTQIMGAHTCNPISGDFSVGVMGHLIENGELTKPVRGMTIAGNIIDLLQSIDLIANNLRFFGSVGSPSFRCRNITLAGE